MNFFSNLRAESNPSAVYFDLIRPTPIPMDDPCGCKATFNSSMAAASSAYADALEAALNIEAEEERSLAYAQAVLNYNSMKTHLETNLTNCLLDCDDED